MQATPDDIGAASAQGGRVSEILQVPVRRLRESRVSPSAAAVYVDLLAEADPDGLLRRSAHALAVSVGISDRRFERYLAELESAALIVTWRDGPDDLVVILRRI